MGEAEVREYRRFIELLPLTLAIAGLSPADPGRSFTEDQLEARAMVIKRSYKKAREIVRDIVAAAQQKS